MIQRSVKHPLAKLIKFVCCDVGLEAKVIDQVSKLTEQPV